MRKKITIILIIFFVLLTASAYGLGVIYFSGHFLPGSNVNGFNCSYMTAEEAQELLSRKVKAYVLTIEEKNNGIESLTAEEAGLSYTPDGTARAILLDQDRFLWFLAFEQQKTYEQLSFLHLDEEVLRDSVSRLRCMQPENITRPKDAKIIETSHGYEISPEVEGDLPDTEKVCELLAKAALSNTAVVNLEEEGCYITPDVYQDNADLVRNCAQINRYTSVIITYDFADRKEVVDKDLIKSWLILDENGDYVLDASLVTKYVSELAATYDTFGMTRQFRTYDGSNVTVVGGDYGWAIDVPAETEGLITAIESGRTDVREPIYAYSAWSRDTKDDIGLTYVEIDLTNQRMILYKDGQPIVDTPVVTGNPNIDGNGTPTGCYAIDAMQSPATLTGEDYSSDVTFWMPFCGNVGIHDAGWRSEFGGARYLFEGSHGCVNTPYAAAASIYQNIDVGAPVIVYEREESFFQYSDSDFFE
ncbi:MAG: peptidoglycan binding domain-containing protein [Blautia sp.]|nr:peptidoglycan binding domain-containing protein [Blautia sp.]